jgi:hypothetical protein
MHDWSFMEAESQELSESHLDAAENDLPENWCQATELYDSGGSDTGGADADYGTPGTTNSCK